jgi:4'-phosphopantetheinyl transferase EntD
MIMAAAVGVEDSPLLCSLFTEGVAARVHHGIAAIDDLPVEEAQLVSSSAAVRQADFAAGRLCARAALEALGERSGPLLSDAARAPRWPEGIVGSITHTDGFRGAVVARRAHFAGIGIDAESRRRVGEELWPQLLTAAEIDRLRQQPVERQRELATIIFSAKEAFYKCQYQLTATWLGFEGADVSLDEDGFSLRLLIDVGGLHANHTYRGRFAVLADVVVTGIAIASHL